MEINQNSKITKVTTLQERDLGDEIIVLSPAGNDFHSFKETGLDLWRHIQGEMNAGELLLFVLKEYSVQEDKAWIDIVQFLDECYRKKIIHISLE